MKSTLIILTTIFFFTTLDSISQVKAETISTEKSLQIFYPKKATPSRFFAADISMPNHFETNNNLAKKVGSFYRASGEIIFLQGEITDSFEVPVSGAVIEIWQTNSAGKYHSLLDKNSEYIDANFNMSGRTISDNMGNYNFITVMPGSVFGRAPHINMNIYHEKFGKLKTEIYFENHPFNKTDYQYLAYDDNDRKALTATVRHTNILDTKSIKLCTFDITMSGIHQFKKL
jgi:protocatechuate 3,4-dioxygenase beta subunit